MVSTTSLPFYLVNAFAPTLHAGNQAAVVIFPSSDDPRGTDEEFMHLVALDFNFSETAYLVPLEVKAVSEAVYGLRWFTPQKEVTLCGHATLASASTLFKLNPLLETIHFRTRFSGTLLASKTSDGQVEISLPSLDSDTLSKLTNDPTSPEWSKTVEAVTSALGTEAKQVINIGPLAFGSISSLIVEFGPDVDLEGLKADIKVMAEIAGMIIITQMVPSESDRSLRINSRVFAPGAGIDEDPVTGSAHAYLTGYYLKSPVSARLPAQFRSRATETIIEAKQLSTRGGELECTWDDGKVRLVGKAWEFASGTLPASAD